MDWKILFVLIAFMVYWMYNTIVLSIFSVPHSLSMTFYQFKERKEWQKLLFPVMMILIALLLMPSWLEISEGSDLQFLSFLTCGCLMFVGFSPAFDSSDLENNVHMVNAILATIFSLVWVVFVAKLWYIIIVWLLIILIIALFTKTLKNSYVYWIENAALMSTFTSILFYYIKNI